MRRRTVVLVASALAALTALVALAFVRFRPRDATSSSLAVPAPGRQAVLHVTWHEASTARLPGGQSEGDGTLTGELDLEADLVLAREQTTDDRDAVRAELRDVRTSRVVVSGQEVLATGEAGAKALGGKAIHFVIEEGKVARVLVDRDASSLAVQLTENVARQVLLARPTGDAFEREEQTPAGVLRVRYERAGDAHRRNVVGAVSLANLPDTCTAPCVVSARGEGEVRFTDDDAVAFLSEKRELRAGVPGAPAMVDGKASFEAKRVADGDVALAKLDTSALASKLPGEVFENEADKHASLARLAEGASIEDVLAGIATRAAGGSIPKGWLVRSTAFLELHPEALGEVAIRFEDDALGAEGRLAVLDLLAATGGDAAQAALVRTLGSAVARQDEARLAFVQRLVLVDAPNETTSRAVRARLEESRIAGDDEMAYAEAHVLGAVAGRLRARGAKTEAKAGVDALAEALDAAKSPAARAAYLAALGNAGDPAQVARITKHARHEDPSVRRAAAAALRKTKTPEARSTLLDLAKDTNEEVQVAALDAFAVHPLESEEVRDLSRVLDAPALGGEATSTLVTLLLRQGSPGADVRDALAHVLERTEDPRLAARIRFALGVASNAN